MDGFALGKKMVDDFYDFYDSGDGKGQEGTLAVVDLEKLMKTDFVEALSDMSQVLKAQAGEGLFYDEFISAANSIRYGRYMDYYDLGNMASLLSAVNIELTKDELDQDHIRTENAYSDNGIADKINSIIEDENIIYACGTDGIISRDVTYRNVGGELEHGNLMTSGMYIFFTTPDIINTSDIFYYNEEVSKVIEMMPDKTDGRCKFFEDYIDVLADYALISASGSAVNWLINEENVDRKDIDYAKVKDYWTDGDESKTASDWSWTVKHYFNMKKGGESEEAKAWLDMIIKQQAEEAVSISNITAKKFKTTDGTGFKVHISNAKARSISAVNREIDLEYTALERSIKEDFSTEHQEMIRRSMDFQAGVVRGQINTDEIFDNASAEDIIRWYNKNESEWDVDAPDYKWYAVKDAGGKLHAVAIYEEEYGAYYVAALISAEGEQIPVILKFNKEGDEAVPSEIFFNTAEGLRPIKISELTDSYPVKLCMLVTIREIWEKPSFFLPTSETTFELGPENAGDISLIYTDIKNMSDIADTDGDGEVYHSKFTLSNTYGIEMNITNIVNSAEETVTGINLARVRPGIYTGDRLSPELIYHGETLKEGEDYTWEFYNLPEGEPEPDMTDTGHYRLLFRGKGRFTGQAVRVFSIILSESEAYALVYQAEEDVRLAQAAVQDLIDSGNDTGLDEAFERLVAAQNALADAKEVLNDTRYLLDLAEHEELEDRISALEDEVQDLNSELIKARVIDISYYEVTMPDTVTYAPDGVTPEVTVAGLDPAAYRVIYNYNLWVGTATVTIEGRGANYKGTIVKYFRIIPMQAGIQAVTVGEKEMTVTATKAVDETGGSYYEIRYKTNNASEWKTTRTDKQTVTISDLTSGEVYLVQIRACDEDFEGIYYGEWSDAWTTDTIPGTIPGTGSDTSLKSKEVNPLQISPKAATIKYSKLKKKAQTLSVTKVMTFTSDAQDQKTYALSSAKKGSKSYRKYFKVNETTGTVTVKKGLKKGTYKVKVNVKAEGNSRYNASDWKSVTFKIKVK